MRIGLFGGTVDPIHFGHLRSAEEIREVMELDELWFVPAAMPPHKGYGSLTSFAHRFAMAKLAVAQTESFKVISIENDRPGPSYSVDTLCELRKLHDPNVEFFFIMGSDTFIDIETWKDYTRLTDYACLVIMERGLGDMSRVRELIRRAFPVHHIQDGKDVYVAPDKGSIYLIPVTRLAISGTDIRRRAGAGLSVRFMVPEVVRHYMREKGLYTQSRGNQSPYPESKEGKDISNEEMVKEITSEIRENKGEEIVVLDVRGISALADSFIISHGRSTRHVQGIAENLQKKLRKKGIKCKGIEGEREGKWILMDYGDVVVHLFYEPVRELYDLEGL